MKRGNKLLITVAVVLAVLLVSGVSIYAATNYGSESDPLITLSYLNDKFKPEVLDEMENAIDETASQMKSDLDAQLSQTEDSIQQAESAAVVHSTTDVFTLVTLSSGQKLSCSAGTEMMLRSGGANGYGTADVQLSDSTDGTEISDGSALKENHMYMVQEDGNGITASPDGAEVLVRGKYTVG